MTSITVKDASGSNQTVNTLPALGAAASAAAIPVVPASDWASENHLGEIGARTIIASGSVTRPADTNAYAIGDLIANSVTAGSVTPMSLTAARVNQGTGMVRRVRLKVNDTAWAAAVVRVHFYKNSPTCANGDNGAWSTTESEYLGSCDVTFDKSFSDPVVKGIGVPAAGSEINFDCASSSQLIYALLESRSVVTPASAKVFSLVAEILAN